MDGNFFLTSKEAEVLGKKFAEMLLFSRDADPAKIPALANRKDWQRASPYKRKQAIADIASYARSALLQCGYSREIVEEKTEKFIRR